MISTVHWAFPQHSSYGYGASSSAARRGQTVPIRRRVSSCRSSSVQFKASNCHPACRVLRSSSRFTRTCLLNGELKDVKRFSQNWKQDHLWGKSLGSRQDAVAKQSSWVKVRTSHPFGLPNVFPESWQKWSKCGSQCGSQNFSLPVSTKRCYPMSNPSLASFMKLDELYLSKTCG